MFVEANSITLRIFDSFSLKDKRSVVKSILQKTRNRFNASVSEVADHDLLNQATIGIAVVSNSSRLNQQVFDSIITFIEENYEVEVLSIQNYFDY